MKKRFLLILLSVMATFIFAFGLSACGKNVSFKLNFVVDDAIYATIDTSGDEIIALPDNPTKENYTFDGWYWDKDEWEKSFTANSLLDAPLSSDVSVYAKFTLNKINGVTFEDIETTYDGNKKTIAVRNLPDGASVTYDKANTYIEAGKYTITATISQDNYESLQLTATLTINKAQVKKPLQDDTAFVYNGKEQTYTVTENSLYAIKGNKQINAGNYTVTVSLNDKNNYQWNDKTIADLSYSFNIAKATYDMSGVEFADKTVTYDDESHSIAATNLPDGISVAYENNGKVNAGSYTIIAKFTGDSKNYELISDKTATLTILDAAFEGLSFESKSFTYDGFEKKIEVIGAPSDATITYDKPNKQTNAGEYTIKATIKKQNCSDVTLTATLTINKANVTGITFTDKAFTYSGNRHSLVITGKLPTDVSVTYANNDKINAGTYTVTASFKDDSGNYIVPNDMTAKLIIDKATISGLAFENKTYTYNGEKRSLTISGTLPDEITVSYANNGKTNVGTYSVTATFTCDTENYDIPNDMTAKLTIKKAVYNMSSVSFENKTVTYDGKSHALSISGNLPNGVTVSYANNNQTNANQYIVVASFTGDAINYYAIDDMQAMLTINKATYDMSDVSFVGSRFIYDGTQKFIYVTGELPEGVTVNYTNNGKINANTYTVTAIFTGDTENYNKLPDWTASLIIDKATYDMSSISFENQTFTYDTTAKSALIKGTLPDGVEVSYVGNEKTDVGTYTITAKFNGDSNNYHLVSDMTATLKINQAVPYIKEVSCDQALNVYSMVELIADTDVAGTIALDNGQTLTLGFKTYSWTFIPEDTHNYTNARGTVGLTVCALVSYYNDGVLFSSQNIVLNNSATVPTGTPLRAVANGYRYTFSHWSIEENGVEYNFTNAITVDLNLYAVYDSEEIVYTINYYETMNADNGNIETYTVSTETTLLSIEKEHYVFNGWTDKNGNGVTKINKGTFGTLDLYATWTPIEYAITYNLGYRGVVNGNNPATYNVEDSFSFVNATYDEYHTFAGWYLEANYINEKSLISVGESGAITLYAKWNFSGTYISTAEELNSVRANPSGVYELTQNIEVSDWESIGSEVLPFSGYFNGNTYTISGGIPFVYNTGYIINLYCDGIIVMNNNGRVSYCRGQIVNNLENGIISNSYMDGASSVSVSDGDYIYQGVLVANNSGLIESCFVNSDITYYCGNSIRLYIGLICGTSSGTIRDCYAVGSIKKLQIGASVSATYITSIWIGGIAGEATDISNCYVFADLEAKASYKKTVSGSTYWPVGCSGHVGGISALGQNVSNCYYYGTITSNVHGTVYGSGGKFLGRFDATNEVDPISLRRTGIVTNNYSYNTLNKEALQNSNFVKETLGWDENIWHLQDGQYPKLWFEEE